MKQVLAAIFVLLVPFSARAMSGLEYIQNENGMNRLGYIEGVLNGYKWSLGPSSDLLLPSKKIDCLVRANVKMGTYDDLVVSTIKTKSQFLNMSASGAVIRVLNDICPEGSF